MLLHSRILIWLLCCTGVAAAHSPLLPKPQQIQYGPGRLPLRDLHIRLAGNPADEDRFAASELAAILSARSTTPVPIAESSDGPGPSIVLKRSGPVASLPLPGERPGPDSREAYRLKMTALQAAKLKPPLRLTCITPFRLYVNWSKAMAAARRSLKSRFMTGPPSPTAAR